MGYKLVGSIFWFTNSLLEGNTQVQVHEIDLFLLQQNNLDKWALMAGYYHKTELSKVKKLKGSQLDANKIQEA